MGIKLNESNYITIAIIIKRFFLIKRTYLTIGCRPKMFLGKVNPVYFVHHNSCLFSLKLHSLRFVVRAKLKMNKNTGYSTKLPSFLLLTPWLSVPRVWAGLSALRSQSPPPIDDVTGIHEAEMIEICRFYVLFII